MSEDNKNMPWQHELDAKKHLTEVHMDFKKHLGTDFKLAKFDDKDREFVMSILTAGMMISDLCPNPDVGEELKQMDFAYINSLAVLKFNQSNNMIVDRITNWQREQEEEKTAASWIERMTSRIQGKAKPKQVESESD